MKKRLFLMAMLVSAACTVPVQPVVVEAPEAAATVDMSALKPATVAPSVPAPATLETALIASLWDEASGTSSIVPVDPLTGEALRGYAPIALGTGYSSARSADGRWLATINYGDHACDAWAGGTRCQPSEGVLHLIELAAWRDRTTTVQVGTNATFVLFSPQGGALAVGQSEWPDHSVLLADAASGRLKAEAKLDFYPREAAFSADGQSLYVYGLHYEERNGFNPEPHVAVLDAGDLTLRWETALTGVLDGQYVPAGAQDVFEESVWWLAGVVFAPGAQRLYVVHADDDMLTTVDLAAQAVTRTTIGPARSWLDRLIALTAGVAEAKMLNGTEKQAVLSADEQRLYVAGAHVDAREGAYERTPLGLQVIDAPTGVELQTLDTSASTLALAPGGRHLFLTEWESRARTTIVALDGLRLVGELPRRDVHLTRLVNGQPAVMAIDVAAGGSRFYWLDTETYAEVAQWEAGEAVWLVP
jgi:hypothetical protein